jgi:hypothetical protein
MKRALIFAIYIAIGITGAAFGQTKVTTSAEHFTTTATLGVKPTPLKDTSLFAPPSRPVERVVLTHGAGGSIAEHRLNFEGYFRAGTKIELRGPCYSACTLMLGYLERDNLCIAPGAFMAFHAARGAKYANYMSDQTRAMYETYPPEIRRWIDRNGGWEKLPSTAFGRCTITNCGRSAIRGANRNSRVRWGRTLPLRPLARPEVPGRI